MPDEVVQAFISGAVALLFVVAAVEWGVSFLRRAPGESSGGTGDQ